MAKPTAIYIFLLAVKVVVCHSWRDLEYGAFLDVREDLLASDADAVALEGEDEEDAPNIPLLPPPGIFPLNTKPVAKAPSMLKTFSDSTYEEYVTVRRKKVKKTSKADEKKREELKNPMSGEEQMRVGLLKRNQYFNIKLKENGDDWYKATIALVANLCTDAESKYDGDECDNLFEKLAQRKSECARGRTYWDCEIMGLEEDMQPYFEQERKAGRVDKVAEHFRALFDMYPTHGTVAKVRKTYGAVLETIDLASRAWKKIVVDVKAGLSDAPLRRAFLANCRALPSILDIESKVHPLDCSKRIDDAVHERKINQARCIVLAGETIWNKMEPPMEKVNTTLDLNRLSEDACEDIVSKPWVEESLKPTQDVLACSAVTIKNNEPPIPIKYPHVTLPTVLTDWQRLFWAAPSDDKKKALRHFEWKSKDVNTFRAFESDLVKSWGDLQKALSQSVAGCAELTADVQKTRPDAVKEACMTTSAALDSLAVQAEVALGTSSKHLNTTDSPLFTKLKEVAKTELLKVLLAYRADESLFQEMQKAKEEKDKQTPAITLGPNGIPLPPGLLGKGESAKSSDILPAPVAGGILAPPEDLIFIPQPQNKNIPPAPGILPPPGLFGGGPSKPAEKRNFTPAPRVPVEQIDIWDVVDSTVELWQVIFDSSRTTKKHKTGKAFADVMTSSVSLSRKCSMLSTCMTLPDTLKAIHADVEDKKATLKGWDLKSKLVRIENDKKALTSFCKDEGMCHKVTTYWHECSKSSDCPLPDPSSLEDTDVLWCERTMEGLQTAMRYGATDKGIQLSESCDVTVHTLNDEETAVTGEFTAKDVEKAWLQPLSVIAAVKCPA